MHSFESHCAKINKQHCAIRSDEVCACVRRAKVLSGEAERLKARGTAGVGFQVGVTDPVWNNWALVERQDLESLLANVSSASGPQCSFLRGTAQSSPTAGCSWSHLEGHGEDGGSGSVLAHSTNWWESVTTE